MFMSHFVEFYFFLFYEICYEIFTFDMCLCHCTVMSQSKAFHLNDTHFTASNLSVLANQNADYKSVTREFYF